MCGRYTLVASPEELSAEFDVDVPAPLTPRYNIAPTQPAPVVIYSKESGLRELTMLRWGLIPRWAKDPSIGSRMINARSETVAEKPAFRDALQRRRGLVPCSGFYEWKVLDPGAKKPVKQPYYIRRADQRLFALAGLWDHWRSPDGDDIGSFTILTTEANELVRDLHDRMPVMVRRDDFDLWLDTQVQDTDRLRALLRPFPATELTTMPVSRKVNSPRFDDPACLEPA